MAERIANEARGEVAFTVGEQAYVLRLTTNAICAVQKRTGKTYGELVAQLGRVDYSDIRELFWAALQPYHAKAFPTLEKAGDLIDEAGRHNGVLEVLLTLLQVNRPPAKRGDGGSDGDDRPRTAQAGTGDNSGVTPDASA